MRRVVSLYKSSVGKKILMAVTGLFLFLFVLGHMAGNLKLLQGCEAAAPGDVAAGLSYPGQVCAMDTYAEFLRDVGYPALPHGALLWGFRIALLIAVGVHAVAAFQLWKKSREARGSRYAKEKNLSFSYASRTMRWGGVILAAFIVYHILHFTTGQAHTDYVYGGVHRNFVIAFQNPLVWGAYVVAQAALCFHVYHGVWSATQTLGVDNPRIELVRRPAAAAFALLLFVGFLTPPTLVLTGAIG